MGSMRRAVCASVATMALALHTSSAACPPGTTAPSVTTVMALTGDTAAVVAPDCSSSSVSLSRTLVGDQSFVFEQDSIDRIASLPSRTLGLYIEARLARGADFSGASELVTVIIVNFDARLLEDLRYPPKLEKLTLKESPSVKSVDKLRLPSTLRNLGLFNMGLSSLKTPLPSSVTMLTLNKNTFSSINFPLPPNLSSLNMDHNPIPRLERIVFPNSLATFTCYGCGITQIRGVQWSRKLIRLELADNPIQEFELRQSDFDTLSKLQESMLILTTTLSVCADKEATTQVLQGNKVCVISDERFDSLYTSSGGATTSPPSSGSSGGDDTESTPSQASGDDSSDGNNGTNSTRSPSGSGSSGGVRNDGGGGNGGGGAGVGGAAAAGGSSTREIVVKERLNSTVIGIAIAVGGVFAVLFVIVSYRHHRSSRRAREKETAATLMPYDTPKQTQNEDPASSNGGGSSQEYLSNDIRNDKALIPYRIDQKEIRLSKQIARGGFGIIYRGVYSGRAVAVKQMLPDAWRNETQLMDFMDEIRLCASLSHPKIVEFIGVAWTSLRDISVVIEFMDGGDLHSLLHKHAHAQSLVSSTTSFASSAAASSSATSYVPARREWFKPWTTAAINSKTLIAKDIAEAVVYLHSFSNPIVHRDLKARNVLLDTRGNAKLSDFGISREMAVDETMTSEVGTSAWIAPEVLRGDRYSERADMYSFGVLLVELDKCRHPYAGEDTLVLMDGSSIRLGPVPLEQPHRQAQETRSQAMHQNMKIAMLVSAGHLRPRPSATCPARVRSLITRCLSFAPEDRPSAMEAHYELRQILADF